MAKKTPIDSENFKIEFINGRPQPGPDFDKGVNELSALYLRAMSELGYRRKTKKKPVRRYDVPKRKSVRGIEYK